MSGDDKFMFSISKSSTDKYKCLTFCQKFIMFYFEKHSMCHFICVILSYICMSKKLYTGSMASAHSP